MNPTNKPRIGSHITPVICHDNFHNHRLVEQNLVPINENIENLQTDTAELRGSVQALEREDTELRSNFNRSVLP